MRQEFHVELEAYRHLFKELHEQLLGTSFLTLWGRVVAIRGSASFELLNVGDTSMMKEGAILLPLDNHLQILSVHFGIRERSAQLQLFPAVGLG